MPERGMSAMELPSEPAPEAHLRSPEAEKREERIRKTFLESLAASKLRAAVLAMAVLAPDAVKSVEGSKAWKLATDNMSLKDVAAWEDRPKLERLPSYEAMRRELEEAVGEAALEEEIPVHSQDYIDAIRDMRKAQERSEEPLAVEGFDERFGIPDEDIAGILTETLPSGWTGAGTVSTFRVAPESFLPVLNKHRKTSGEVAGACSDGLWNEPSEIMLAPNYGLSSQTRQVAVHEFVHAGDWNRSNTLAPEDRLTLLYLVHERVSAPDHLRFSYVEGITYDDKQKEHLDKCTEYFAELVGYALDIPARTKEAWESGFREMAVKMWAEPGAQPSPDAFGAKDLKLVNWYLIKVDPSFKPWEAAAKRQELIRATMTNAYERAAEESLLRISSPEIRTALLSLIGREDKMEKRLAEASLPTGAPKEVREYIRDWQEAHSKASAWPAWNKSPRLHVARESLNRLAYVLESISNISGALSSVRESGTVKLMDEMAEEAERALQSCSPEDMEQLAREIQKRSDVQHGHIAFHQKPPASFGPYVQTLKDKGLL